MPGLFGRVSRTAYRTASISNDLKAISRGPGPTVARFAYRKPLWRFATKQLRKALR